MSKINKFTFKKGFIYFGLITVLLVFAFVAGLFKFSKISLNGKVYSCLYLTQKDRKNLIVVSELINSMIQSKNNSLDDYDKKISNCGTEKEYQMSPESEAKWNEIVPENIRTMMEENRSTETYTIKDFQECKELWDEDKDKAEKDFDFQIQNLTNDLNGILQINKCAMKINNN